MDVYCFKTVEAIKEFMMQPDILKFANAPPSMFRIISNCRMFIGDGGLCKFLDDPSTPWAFTYPATMIFHGAITEGLEILEGRPNAVKSSSPNDVIAFVSFGFMLPASQAPAQHPPAHHPPQLWITVRQRDATREAALKLYRRFGYAERGPFGDYAEGPHSVFMEKRLG